MNFLDNDIIVTNSEFPVSISPIFKIHVVKPHLPHLTLEKVFILNLLEELHIYPISLVVFVTLGMPCQPV